MDRIREGHHTFENTIEPVYGLDKYGLMKLCYIEEKMSDIEIIEKIEKDTGVRFSRTALKKWRDDCFFKSRAEHTRFQLAADKGRFNHLIIARKIDYRNRPIDYKEVNIKRLRLMSTYKYRYGNGNPIPESNFAFGLERTLSNRNKNNRDLAQFLGVSIHCIKGWCALNNRINKVYWKKICSFLNCKPDEIFGASPTKSQRLRLKRKGKL